MDTSVSAGQQAILNFDTDIAACTPGTGSRTDDNESSLAGLNVSLNNVVYQRRRVNPESLAMRLGPELVRDLDALIMPGNTDMPSFAVRKELQERYNIDRRHIYDYFHSRGLRVVKEDKNPVSAKGVAPTPLPNLRSQRQAPIKTCRPHGSYPVAVERKFFRSRGITKAKPGRPKKNLAANLKVTPSVDCETQESNESTVTAPASECSPLGAVSTATYVAVNPLVPCIPSRSMVNDEVGCGGFNSVVNPLDESFSVKRAIGDIAYAYRHKLVFERMQELSECPAKPTLTEDRLFSRNETSPCSASGNLGLLLPHVRPLTRDERHAIYESLSSSLGPAHGIQECQGTYRKYMETRTKLYFEGLLSGHAQQATSTSIENRNLSDWKQSEFRHWLSETSFLKRDGSQRLHAIYRNTNVAKQDEIDGSRDKQFRQRSVPHRMETIDELFPVPSKLDDGDPIADSPVIHTRQITTHGRDHYSQYRVGDESLFLAETGLDSPRCLVVGSTSAMQVRPTHHPQIHGLSGFSGPQQAPTSGAETVVDYPQFPEHVPNTAHTLQRPATLRRTRNMSNNYVRNRVPSASSSSSSPRKRPLRDHLDRIWTLPVASRDPRRRTPSAAGDI